mgnify:CR=1 FL=1
MDNIAGKKSALQWAVHLSTALLVKPLAELTGRSVRFIEDCQGPEAARALTTMLPGNIGILENTRFHDGEESNDPALVAAMAALGTFGVSIPEEFGGLGLSDAAARAFASSAGNPFLGAAVYHISHHF